MINALRLMSKIQDYKNELNECLRNEVYTDYDNGNDYDRPTKQDLEIVELRIKIKVCMEILQDD